MMKKIVLFLSICGLLGMVGCAETPQNQPKTPATESNESDGSESETSDLRPMDPPGTHGDEPVEPIDYASVGVPCEPGPTCPGAQKPEWSLLDFQPMSSRFGDYYGLEQFDGKVTLVSLHAAWCAYCRTQALLMNQMWQELLDEGHDVQFVTVNKDNAADENYRDWMLYEHDQEGNRLYDELGNSIFRCTFPIFQDTPEDGAWALHGGNKDDFYIYDAEGALALYLPAGGDISTRLSNDAGYANLKNAVIWVLTGENPADTAAESEEEESQEDSDTDTEGEADAP
jgi:thiol-disulfide isomerase/thioredoxin